MKQRKKQEIWAKLFDFYEIESKSTEFDVELELENIFANYDISKLQISNSVSVVHLLTHQKLFIRFYQIEIFDFQPEFEGGSFKNIEAVEKSPKPIVIENYLKTIL